MDEARAYGIPIICVVDADRQTQREVIDCYMEKGFGWLFDSQASCSPICLSILRLTSHRTRQVISYNSQGRDHAIDLIISAIKRAIQYCHRTDTLTTIKSKESTPEDKQNDKPKDTDVHESNASIDALVSQLKEKVIAVFGSARSAFEAHSKDGVVGKKELKKLLKQVLPSLKQGEAKRLKKILSSKRMSLPEFCLFIGGSEETTDTAKMNNEPKASGLALLPPEVPEVRRHPLKVVC